ncbi:MAG TPA: XDD4 family exosortase-dependent surface protein [Phycisphaerae bacterium]|jgi:hypothetical protein
MRSNLGWFLAVSLAYAGLWKIPSAQAVPLVSSGSLGSLAASAEFDVSGSNLIVTLTNTSPVDAQVPSDILTALFFDTVGASPTLVPVSAVLGPGAVVFFGGTDPGNVVGGEWAYRQGLSGAPLGASRGISSAGFDLFGPPDLFPGTNLQGPDSPDGIQYGITSAGDDPATGNAAVTGANALIKNEVVFTLSGLPDGFDPSTQITHVFFQYGTALTDSGFTPEPSSLALLGIGTLLAFRRSRARR